MSAYYNEFDPWAAQMLRNLIQAGHIAPGYVDERSIEDVCPSDLQGYTQCHFFAGVGAWSLALRNAGWADTRPVWTASCPCQPFSTAGEGNGFADERHLWPALQHLIREHAEWCRQQKRPAPVLYGEQVASKDSEPWLDLVQDDLEGMGYAFGAVAFPSASIGAPHIRDRTYWMAHGNNKGLEGRTGMFECGTQRIVGAGGLVGRMGHARGERWIGRQGIPAGSVNGRADAGRIESDHGFISLGQTGFLGSGPAGPVNGQWANADWLFCRDGKWRPVESGAFPLAHGAASRVGRLRAYGNAINPAQAQIFIEVAMQCM